MSHDLEFLYTIKPIRAALLSEEPTDNEAATIKEHFDYLQSLATRGVVILAGRTLNTDQSSFGIVILRARDEATAQAIMEDDPAVKQRIMQATLYPYRVALGGHLEE
jgi:uncharacterized protein YciI